MQRKILSSVVAIALTLLLVTGCSSNSGGDSNKTTSSPKASDPVQTDVGNEGNGKHHLKIMGTTGWAPTDNWDEVPEYSAYKILQSWFDDADLEVTWEVIQSDQYAVVLQTRMSSGTDMPDLVKVSTMDTASILSLAEQGTILPINDMIEEYSNGNIVKAFDTDYPDVRAVNTAPDGNMYWFSNVQSKYYGDNNDANGSFSILYRKDWADKLNIQEPKTLDEFTDMFRRFREEDANGNGQADELLSIDVSGFSNVIAQWFDLVPGTLGIDPSTDEVVSPWQSETIGQYFTYIRELFNEGIMDPSLIGNDEIVTQKTAENKIAGISHYTNWIALEPQIVALDPDVQYAPLMPIQALENIKPASLAEPGALVWEQYAVTSACEDPEAVIKLMDIVYTDEYGLLTAFGEEGKTFNYVDGVITPVEGLDFEAAKEQRIIEGAMLWNGVLPRVQKVDMRQQVGGRDEFKTKVTLDLIEYDKKYYTQLDNFLAVPTDEEIDRINALKTNVDTASQELATKLSLGNISIENIENEVTKLEDMGLNELKEITQNRYNRYLANKPD